MPHRLCSKDLHNSQITNIIDVLEGFQHQIERNRIIYNEYSHVQAVDAVPKRLKFVMQIH